MSMLMGFGVTKRFDTSLIKRTLCKRIQRGPLPYCCCWQSHGCISASGCALRFVARKGPARDLFACQAKAVHCFLAYAKKAGLARRRVSDESNVKTGVAARNLSDQRGNQPSCT